MHVARHEVPRFDQSRCRRGQTAHCPTHCIQCHSRGRIGRSNWQSARSNIFIGAHRSSDLGLTCATPWGKRLYELLAIRGQPVVLHEYCRAVRELIAEVWQDTVDSTCSRCARPQRYHAASPAFLHLRCSWRPAIVQQSAAAPHCGLHPPEGDTCNASLTCHKSSCSTSSVVEMLLLMITGSGCRVPALPGGEPSRADPVGAAGGGQRSVWLACAHPGGGCARGGCRDLSDRKGATTPYR